MAEAVKVDSPMRYFNEYLYYEMIRAINIREEGRDGQLVKKRQAMEMREMLTEDLKQRYGKDMSNAPRSAFIGSLKAVCDKVGVDLSGVEGAQWEKYYKSKQQAFSSYTGINGSGNAKDYWLPVSPYDPRYANRETFLNNGTSLLYARSSELSISRNGMDDENLDLYSAPGGDITSKQVNAGTALTSGDKSGYSILSTLVSERNAREVRAFINQDGNPDPMYCDPKQVQQAYQVLSALRDEGITFEFKRDERPGQLKARVFVTGMPSIDVRVLDPYSPQYGGCSRIYLDGVQGYYSTDKQQKKYLENGKTETTTAAYIPTVKERVDLIKFGLGQQVMRGDGKPVGTPGQYNVYNGKANETYHSGKSFSAMVRPYPNDNNSHVFIRLASNRVSDEMHFKTPEESDMYLVQAVESARENYRKHVNVEGLIAAAEEHVDELDTYVPVFSSDPDIAAVQERYWEVLSGKKDELLQPGVSSDEYDDSMDALEETGMLGTALEDFTKSSMVYDGTPSEKVQKHFDDLMDIHLGTFVPDEDGMRFNPVTVGKYMDSAFGPYRNSVDIVTALKSSHIPADSLRGNEYYNQTIKDKMIEFDMSSARQMRFEQDPFMKTMYETIRSAITENGVQVSDKDILIDDNGIVKYTATKYITKGYTAKGRKDITGTLGQIFAPDERGLITTKYAGSTNFTFCPAKVADVLPNKPGEDLPYEQRVKIKTYESSMVDGIRYAIRDALMEDNMEVGSTTVLNNIPRRNQGVRFEPGELEAKDPALQQAIIDAETNRVVFSNFITSNAGRYDLYKYNHNPDHDPLDDVHVDAIQLMGGENYAILRPEESAGIFDPKATGTGPAQGSRYLVKGATIRPDGTVEPARKDDGTIDVDARNGLSEYIDAHMGDFDAIDRYDMTVTALRHCKSVSAAKVAQVTFGGWGHGDAVVISKEWADANGIHNIGDKVSDFHGNKGVTSLIVDRDMDLEDAKRLGIEEPVKWFKANPDLDIVMSPYSAVSRFNGGLYREAMLHEAEDLASPADENGNSTVYKGAIGQLDMIVMEQTADKKSTDYEDEEEAQTASRNFGGQTGWSLGSNGALNVIREAFAGNAKSVVSFRELLIATGMDISETGDLRIGYESHAGEERKVFEMQEMVYKTKLDRESGTRVPDLDKTGHQKVDFATMKQSFGLAIEQSGGMMELPFPIRYPAGKAQDENGKLVDIGLTPEIDPAERSVDSVAAYSGKTYAVPIMSPFLRSGQDFNDGTSRTHDYTGQYLRLYECGLKYRDAVSAGATEAELAKIQAQGQQEYNKITDDIIASKFTGKKNIIRTTLLGAKQKAMTAVVVPDPRLNLEDVSMNPKMAESLGVKEGQKLVTWRDPLLTRTGMSSNIVRYDEDQRCMGVAPLTGEYKDRDHDGDTEGIKAVRTKEAREELDGCMNIKNRLLNKFNPPDENGLYELAVDSGEDHEAGLVASPELRQVYEGLKKDVNAFEKDYEDGKISDKAVELKRQGALALLNKYVHAVQDSCYGVTAISYSDPEACFKSISQYVEQGIKGNAKKLDTFARYMGVSYERDANGNIDYSTFTDVGENVASEQERLDPLDARNMQQAYTGPAGGQTIQSMVYAAGAVDSDFTKGLTGRKVTASEIMDAFTGTNKSVTQAVLQVKHSASQARSMEEVIQSYLSNAAAGFKMEKVMSQETGEIVWQKSKDGNGKPFQCTPREYVEQMTDIYENALGVRIVPEKVRIMADALTDPSTGLIKTMEQRRKDAPPLQRMAYDGSGDSGFATIQKMAYEGRNLYEGSPNLNDAMMPRQIRSNQRAAAMEQQMQDAGVDTKDVDAVNEYLANEAEASGRNMGADVIKKHALVDGRTRESSVSRRATEMVGTAKKREVHCDFADDSGDNGLDFGD